jgi:hypothetical protein
MKRIYTDDRFPGVEVVNFGDTKFLGTKDGQPVHEFVSCETDREVVSEAFAQRRANDYFDRLASHQESLPEMPTGIAEARSVPVQIADYLLSD